VELAGTLKRQAWERFSGADASPVKWLLNLPKGIGDILPWILFAPLLWHAAASQGLHARSAALLRGGRWAVAGCFVGLLLIPGVLPRYILPLTTPFSVLLALVLWECPRRIRHWWRYAAFALTFIVFVGAVASPFLVASAQAQGAQALHPALAVAAVLPVFCGALLLMALRRRLHETLHLTLWTGLVVVMAMTLYATCAVPWMRLKEDLRPFAQRIDAAMPPGQSLIAYSVGDYAPLLAVLFYLEAPHQYASNERAAPMGEAYYLVRGKDRGKFEKKFRILEEPVAPMEGKEGEEASFVARAERKR
jgi:hypothetical protein